MQNPAPAFHREEQPEAPAPAAPETQPSRHAVHETAPATGVDDAIYQKMLSEWLVDPNQIAQSEDLNWESVWDHGWSAAAAAEDAPVLHRTDDGLPLREPGARLVPGAMDSAGSDEPAGGGHHRNGGAHRSTEGEDEVASAAEFDAGGQGGGEHSRGVIRMPSARV